jgi:hypothetical protein
LQGILKFFLSLSLSFPLSLSAGRCRSWFQRESMSACESHTDADRLVTERGHCQCQRVAASRITICALGLGTAVQVCFWTNVPIDGDLRARAFSPSHLLSRSSRRGRSLVLARITKTAPLRNRKPWGAPSFPQRFFGEFPAWPLQPRPLSRVSWGLDHVLSEERHPSFRLSPSPRRGLSHRAKRAGIP